jgi:energy-coupling factor transporter transmembrane protein EcfT
MTKEKHKAIWGIFPDSDSLNTHFWHRLAKVIWGLSMLVFIYFIFLTLIGELDPNFWGFLIVFLFSYLFVPAIYRAILYIFTGDSWGEKKQNG